MKDYEKGAFPPRVKGGDITRRKRSKASGSAPGAHPGTAGSNPLESPAPILYQPHGNCDVEPCPRCNHATLTRLGLRRGSPILEEWEREEI